jgi:2-oxo-4-hydroxy-4-carboxy--5-ureidoimidazoline (OHCU) decarboxylase
LRVSPASATLPTKSGGRWIAPIGLKPSPRTRKSASAQPQARNPRAAGPRRNKPRRTPRLAKNNRAYLLRFGFIFIVDATGKSRAEILAILEQRLQNNPQKELREAAEQQRRIARRRLEKLFASDGGETKSA